MQRHDAGGEFPDRRVGVPGDAVTDAAEPAATGLDLGIQHVAHPGTQRQVGVADDGLGDAAGAVVAGCAHGGDAVDEFDLAHRRHLLGAVLAVHRLTFHEHGGDDVMAAADVGQQVGQEVAAAMRCVPEVMMWVDDRQVRFQRRLARAASPATLSGRHRCDRRCREIRLLNRRLLAFPFPYLLFTLPPVLFGADPTPGDLIIEPPVPQAPAQGLGEPLALLPPNCANSTTHAKVASYEHKKRKRCP